MFFIYIIEGSVLLCRNRERQVEPNHLPTQWAHPAMSPNFSAASFKNTCCLPVVIIPLYAQDSGIWDFRLLLSVAAPITCLELLQAKSWCHQISGLFPSVR